MNRVLRLIAYGLVGIVVTAGLTGAAFVLSGNDIAQPAPLRISPLFILYLSLASAGLSGLDPPRNVVVPSDTVMLPPLILNPPAFAM